MNTTKTKLLPLLILVLLVPLVQAADVTVDWGTTTRTVPTNFFGYNTQNDGIASYTKVDTNADGTYDGTTNVSFYLSMMNQSLGSVVRINTYLADARYLRNGDMNTWAQGCNESIFTNGVGPDSCAVNVPYGWSVGYAATTANGTFARTTHSRSGFALNISTNLGGGTEIFAIHNLTDWYTTGRQNHTMQLTCWYFGASNNSARVKLLGLPSYAALATNTSRQYNQSWGTVTATWNVTASHPGGVHAYVGSYADNTNRSYIYDDCTVTDLTTGEEFYYWATNSSNTTRSDLTRQSVANAYNNGYKVSLSIDSNSEYQANVTPECASKTYGCLPANMSITGQTCRLLLATIKNYTANGTYLSAIKDLDSGNEFDLTGVWYASVPAGNWTFRGAKGAEQQSWVYDCIKSAYPSILSGGPSLSAVSPTHGNVNGTYQLRVQINGTIGKFDYVPFHDYLNTPAHGDDWFRDDFNNVTAACAEAGVSCNITMSEYHWSSSQNSPEYQKHREAALIYATAVKTPTVTQALIYRLGDKVNYSSYSDGSPQKWAVTLEPGVNGGSPYISGFYNGTKAVSTVYAPGSSIVNCSSMNSGVACVAGVNGSRRFVTLINKNETNATVSLQSLNLPGNYFLYRSSGGIGYPTSGYAYTVTLTNSSVMTFELIFDASLLTSQEEYINSAANGLLKILGWLAAILVLGVFALFVGAATGKLDPDIGDNLLKIGLSVMTVMLVLVVGIIIILSIGE